jgi:hypothetical protein
MEEIRRELLVYALMPKSIIKEEVQCILAKILELMSNEFPQGLPHINLIPGFNLPNKLVYRLSPKKAEDLHKQAV